MKWSEAHKFCDNNGSKTLPLMTDDRQLDEFQESVLKRLPAELRQCSVWIDLDTTVRAASLMDRRHSNHTSPGGQLSFLITSFTSLSL